MLWLVQRTFYGDTPEPLRRHFSDLSRREWAIVLPLVALMVWMGVYSQTFLHSVRAGNDRTLSLVLRDTNARQRGRGAWPAPATLIGQLSGPAAKESADAR